MSTQYLYHWVPKNMQGNILYPLNTLKEIMPEVYKYHEKKYENRMDRLKNKVPLLNCLWNDVLHFAAVHPSIVKKLVIDAGFTWPTVEYFEVPVELVAGDNSVVYLFNKFYVETHDPSEFELFDINNMDKYRTIKPETLEYYKKCKAEGKGFLVYKMIPHILYKGNIDTTNIKKIVV